MTASLEGTTSLLKNFIYLDEAKLNSFVSQAFSGTTEYILSSASESEEIEEQQKGGIVSGKILKAIINGNKNTVEKKFLYDYSYKIFEEHIEQIDALKNIAASTAHEEIGDCRFVKIKGKIKFIDISILLSTLQNFPDITEAFAFVTQWEEIKGIESNSRGKNIRDSVRNKIKKDANKDADFYKNLKKVLEFGYKDMFAVQSTIGNILFTAEIKREYLREDEQFLIRKYSRISEKDFVMLGTIASSGGSRIMFDDDSKMSSDNMRIALFQIIDHFYSVEKTMLGNLDNEIIIDPIAIYCEV